MKKITLGFIAMLLALSVSSCIDRDDEYGYLDADGLTIAVRSVVPQSIIEEMKTLGFPIYGGDNPPNIEGSFLLSPYLLLDSNISTDDVGHEFSDYIYTFYNQDAAALTLELNYENDNGQLNGEGTGGYIVGDGAYFTTFFNTYDIKANGSESETVRAISGKLVAGGIEDVHVSIFMIDDYGDVNDDLIEIGEGRVLYDSDAFSERVGEDETGRPATITATMLLDVNSCN